MKTHIAHPPTPPSVRAGNAYSAKISKNIKKTIEVSPKATYNNPVRKYNQRQGMECWSTPCPCVKCQAHSTQQNQAPAPYPYYSHVPPFFQEQRWYFCVSCLCVTPQIKLSAVLRVDQKALSAAFCISGSKARRGEPPLAGCGAGSPCCKPLTRINRKSANSVV